MASNTAFFLQEAGKPLVPKTVPFPAAGPGSAVIKVLGASISPSAKTIFSGSFRPPLGLGAVPSNPAIGRVHSVGSDATRLKSGQLVFFDFCIAARDDPDAKILQGYIGSDTTLQKEWPEGTFAEYARVPLEKCLPLDESILCGNLGYTIPELAYLGALTVAHGGLQEIGLQAGDTVIVAPATGYFGGAGVQVALAMGANVIAAGRNQSTLSRLETTFKATGRLSVVRLSGDAEADTRELVKASSSPKGVDKYIDFSPPASVGSSHVKACIMALRSSGRCVLMGGVPSVADMPYFTVMHKSLRIQGKFMFDYQQTEQTIKLVEHGLLKLGPSEQTGISVHSFPLDQLPQALDAAADGAGWGNAFVVEPIKERSEREGE